MIGALSKLFGMWYNLSIIVGVVLLAFSLILFRSTFLLLRSGSRAVATVIALEKVSDSDGDSYTPLFRFHTVSNEEVTYRPSFSSNPPGWSVGEETMIAYDPADPTEAKLLTYWGTFAGPIILLATALPFLVIGLGYHLTKPFLV